MTKICCNIQSIGCHSCSLLLNDLGWPSLGILRMRKLSVLLWLLRGRISCRSLLLLGLLRHYQSTPMRVLEIVVARCGPVLHRCFENYSWRRGLRQWCQVSTISLLLGNLLRVLLILWEEVFGLEQHVGRWLGIPVVLVHLLLNHVLISSHLVSVELLGINLFNSVMLVNLNEFSICKYVLVVIFLWNPWILRVHWVDASDDTWQRSLSVHSSWLRSLSTGEELITYQIVLVVNYNWLVIISILGIHHWCWKSFVKLLKILHLSLWSASLCGIWLLQNRLVFVGVLTFLSSRLLSLFFADISWFSLRPDFHDASLRSTSDCDTLAIVWSIFLGEDILEHREFVIINVKQIIFFIVIVVKIYYAEVICWAWLISSLPIVMDVIIVRCLIWILLIELVRDAQIELLAIPILVKMSLKNEIVALIILLSSESWSLTCLAVAHLSHPTLLIVETLDNLIFKAIKNWCIRVTSTQLAQAMNSVEVVILDRVLMCRT